MKHFDERVAKNCFFEFAEHFRKGVSLFGFITLWALSAGGQIDQKPTKESVLNYLNTIEYGKQVDKDVAPFKVAMLKSIDDKWAKAFPVGTPLSPAQKSAADLGLRTIRERVIRFFDFRTLQQISIPIYQKHFTQTQINELTAFAKTATGRQYFATMKAIMYEHETQGARTGQAFDRSVQAEVDRLIASVKNAGVQKR